MTQQRSVFSHQRPVLALPATLAVSRSVRRAFTLVELIVVIGIIVVLVGLTVSVAVIVNQRSETRQVEQAFELLNMALQEWEQVAERQMTYGTNDTPPGVFYDISPEIGVIGDAHELTHTVIGVINRNSESKKILARINPQLLHSHDDELSILDPWGLDIVPVFRGRLVTTEPPDPDGTVRTALENILGICENRRVCFVSAGPDGEFGDLHLMTATANLTQPQLDDIAKAADNIYSSPLLRTRP